MLRLPIVLAVAFSLSSASLGAQAESAVLHGIVRDARGPVAAVNVFVVGTLDGALTDSSGRFEIVTAKQPQYYVATKHEGHRELRRTVPGSEIASIVLTLESASAHALGAVTIEAGRYVAADEPGATLTPLEIVTIPGTAADVNRAIQTLPGVQQVDEGTGLFVRGGDFTETRVFLNDALLLNPAHLQNPAGTFVGTFDPFLLDAIYFSAGGFGARYGDAMSAIAALHTRSRPLVPSATISAGLAAFGADLALPGPSGTGLRLVANRNDLAPVLRLNGSTRQFYSAPHGADLTLSAFWNYRPTARLTLFATQQDEFLETLNETPSVSDTFAVARRDRAIVLTWHDLFGPIAPTVSVSSSIVHDNQAFGSFQLASPSRLDQATAFIERGLMSGATIRSGVETSRITSGISGSIPASGADQRADARTRLYDISSASTRLAAFAEFDARPSDGTRLLAGARVDRASSTSSVTFDPRISGAWRVRQHVTITGAWGVYHQVADPVLAALRDSGDALLPSMRATQTVVGVQFGDSATTLRAEFYEKAYSDLVQQTRDFVTIPGGTGRARGVDVIARAPVIGRLSTRIVYSLVDAKRTDPSTGVISRAPFDVTHTVTVIATAVLPQQIIFGASLRYASGRPFTPVVSAARSAGSTIWTPEFGAPGSLRLPAFARLDFSASWFRIVRPGVQVVTYIALTNALGRRNVFDWRYSPDYSARYEVASVFNRSVYFGGVLTLTKP